eukprot:1838688-Alexandrium_andersonii.AAC.1
MFNSVVWNSVDNVQLFFKKCDSLDVGALTTTSTPSTSTALVLESSSQREQWRASLEALLKLDDSRGLLDVQDGRLRSLDGF